MKHRKTKCIVLDATNCTLLNMPSEIAAKIAMMKDRARLCETLSHASYYLQQLQDNDPAFLSRFVEQFPSQEDNLEQCMSHGARMTNSLRDALHKFTGASKEFYDGIQSSCDAYAAELKDLNERIAQTREYGLSIGAAKS